MAWHREIFRMHSRSRSPNGQRNDTLESLRQATTKKENELAFNIRGGASCFGNVRTDNVKILIFIRGLCIGFHLGYYKNVVLGTTFFSQGRHFSSPPCFPVDNSRCGSNRHTLSTLTSVIRFNNHSHQSHAIGVIRIARPKENSLSFYFSTNKPMSSHADINCAKCTTYTSTSPAKLAVSFLEPTQPLSASDISYVDHDDLNV